MWCHNITKLIIMSGDASPTNTQTETTSVSICLIIICWFQMYIVLWHPWWTLTCASQDKWPQHDCMLRSWPRMISNPPFLWMSRWPSSQDSLCVPDKLYNMSHALPNVSGSSPSTAGVQLPFSSPRTSSPRIFRLPSRDSHAESFHMCKGFLGYHGAIIVVSLLWCTALYNSKCRSCQTPIGGLSDPCLLHSPGIPVDPTSTRFTLTVTSDCHNTNKNVSREDCCSLHLQYAGE